MWELAYLLPHLDLIYLEIVFLLRLTAAPNQIIGGDPVNQAFLTFCVKRQLAVAIQHTRSGNLLL